jgi:hypothetical protein
MKTKDLNKGYSIFGNKGAVWSNQCHIAQNGSFSGRTLCGVPMLSSNWARIEDIQEIGCKECLAIYNEQIKNDKN